MRIDKNEAAEFFQLEKMERKRKLKIFNFLKFSAEIKLAKPIIFLKLHHVRENKKIMVDLRRTKHGKENG